jgi:membrane protein implicated in regulation of membrane protease activity
MNIKPLTGIVIAVSMFPLLAHAQAAETGRGASALVAVFWSVLPIIVVAALIWWFFSRAVRKTQKRSEDYVTAQKLHNERVEQLLERIAKVIEE